MELRVAIGGAVERRLPDGRGMLWWALSAMVDEKFNGVAAPPEQPPSPHNLPQAGALAFECGAMPRRQRCGRQFLRR